MKQTLILLATLSLFAAPLNAMAGMNDGPPEADVSHCLKAFGQCEAACQERNRDSESGLAGCVARCTTDKAACEAAAQYSVAKPWFKRKVDDMMRFLDEFLRTPPDGGEEDSGRGGKDT